MFTKMQNTEIKTRSKESQGLGPKSLNRMSFKPLERDKINLVKITVGKNRTE